LTFPYLDYKLSSAKITAILMLGKLKKRKRLKTHGFRKTRKKVLKKRRAKGRKSLAPTVHSKT
jgi:ribosomal protein L34